MCEEKKKTPAVPGWLTIGANEKRSLCLPPIVATPPSACETGLVWLCKGFALFFSLLGRWAGRVVGFLAIIRIGKSDAKRTGVHGDRFRYRATARRSPMLD